MRKRPTDDEVREVLELLRRGVQVAVRHRIPPHDDLFRTLTNLTAAFEWMLAADPPYRHPSAIPVFESLIASIRELVEKETIH